MSTILTVLCPNGRREQIKVTPNTSILEVLEAACKKQKINPKEFDVSHFNRVLDVTLSVRFSNLTNNSMLTLVPTKKIRTESSVIVGLQLESGERIDCTFDPSSTMWEVVKKCLSSKGEACRNSDVPGEEPVCVYMRQQFTGDDLKSRSLRSLGLTSGKAIIRLMYRSPETMQGQAHIAVPLTKPIVLDVDDHCGSTAQFKENNSNNRKSTSAETDEGPVSKQPCLESEPKTCQTSAMEQTMSSEVILDSDCFPKPLISLREPLGPVISGDVVSSNESGHQPAVTPDSSSEKQQLETEMMDIDGFEESEKEIGEIKYLGPRSALLFNLRDITATKMADIPEDFFVLTIDDVRYMSNEYRRIREEMENQPLLLQSQREAQVMQQLSSYKQAVIRIYFPNKFVLQGTFYVEETVQSVMDFVCEYLCDRLLPFYLYTSPPKNLLNPEHTLFEAGVIPAAIVYFGTSAINVKYLRPEIESQVSDPRAAKRAAEENRKKYVASNQDMSTMNLLQGAISVTSDQNVASTSQPMSTNDASPYQRPQSDGKVPKWFLHGKK